MADSEAIDSLSEVVQICNEDDIQKQLSKKIESLSRSGKYGVDNNDEILRKRLTENVNDKGQNKIGEITPFEANLKEKSEPNITRNTFNATTGLLDLEKYLQRQAEVAAKRKNLKVQKLPSKQTVKKTNHCKKQKTIIKKSDRDLKKIDSTSLETHKSTITKNINEKKNITPDESVNLLEKKLKENSDDSDSEYIPSDESEDWEEGNSRRKNTKKRKQISQKNVKFSYKKKRILDDGDEELWKSRVEKVSKIHALNVNENDFQTVDNLFKVPKSIWKKLYEYQKVSIRWLWELHGRGLGGLLGDEMGLGKTVQVIAFLAGLDCSELLSDGCRFRGLGPTLLVCPATLLEQWIQHFHDWWPTLRVSSLHQSSTFQGDPEELLSSLKTGGVLLASYSTVVRQSEILIPFQWHYVILDEGHKIRNPQAKITKIVKKFSTPHRILLTGSPMQNSLKELWSLFDFILPGKLGTLDAFTEHCALPIIRGGYSNASFLQEATALQVATMLKEAINPYMLRRTKDNVQHHLMLPEKNEQVLFCSLTAEQTDLYKKYLLSENVSTIIHDKSAGRHRAKLLVALTALRKICNHPDLFTFGSDDTEYFDEEEQEEEEEETASEETKKKLYLENFGSWEKSGKLTVVRSLLKIWKRQGHRVVIFSQGTQMLHVVEGLVQKEGYKYMRLDGKTPMGERQNSIRKFNDDSDYFVFISTTRVGGLGINLTGADRVIIYDPDWNPATDTQAKERTYRIGQTKKVTIYRLITVGTIEEKIYHRQIFKQLLANRILEDPRQKRLFQTSDLTELFNLNEFVDGSVTESERLFNNSKEGKSKKTEVSAVFEGKKVSCLVGRRLKRQENETDARVVDDDNYVLNKLFSKSCVTSAMGHDTVLSNAKCDGDTKTPMQKWARETAQESMDLVRQSRKWCYRPSWN